MYIVLIDDLRTIEDLRKQERFRNLPEDTRIARSYNDGIKALSERTWDHLLLDHDLADFTGPDESIDKRVPGKKEWTGYDVLCWLERNPVHLPKKISLVTANPVGSDRMRMVIRKLYSDSI